MGTLLLRNYRNKKDQGHLAIIIEHYPKDNTKTLYSNIIHSYLETNGSGQIGITNLGQSHFSLVNKNGTGYYEYAVLPQNWLN